MLQAEKRAVQASIKQQAIMIYFKQLELYAHNMSMISNQGSVLAGFAYMGLTMDILTTFDKKHQVMRRYAIGPDRLFRGTAVWFAKTFVV